MKTLALSLAASLAILSSSTASAAVFRIGPVRVVTRPAAVRPAYPVRVAPAPAVRAAVHTRRATARGIVHQRREEAREMIHDVLWP
jgi:hypothetical protein